MSDCEMRVELGGTPLTISTIIRIIGRMEENISYEGRILTEKLKD